MSKLIHKLKGNEHFNSTIKACLLAKALGMFIRQAF